MRKIKYDGKGKTVCPWGMKSFAGDAKIVGSLGCMNCVNHAGQSYTADGGVVCCLRGETEKVKRAERPKRSDGLNGLNGADGSDGKTKAKKVTKKVSRNNNTKMKKEEKR